MRGESVVCEAAEPGDSRRLRGRPAASLVRLCSRERLFRQRARFSDESHRSRCPFGGGRFEGSPFRGAAFDQRRPALVGGGEGEGSF